MSSPDYALFTDAALIAKNGAVSLGVELQWYREDPACLGLLIIRGHGEPPVLWQFDRGMVAVLTRPGLQVGAGDVILSRDPEYPGVLVVRLRGEYGAATLHLDWATVAQFVGSTAGAIDGPGERALVSADLDKWLAANGLSTDVVPEPERKP